MVHDLYHCRRVSFKAGQAAQYRFDESSDTRSRLPGSMLVYDGRKEEKSFLGLLAMARLERHHCMRMIRDMIFVTTSHIQLLTLALG